MSHLAITLLGTFQVTMAAGPASFATEASRALLAYLAVEASVPHRRGSLSALFWPDQPEARARANLRQTLHRLRASVGDIDNPVPHLLVSNQEIQINPQSDHWLDVAEFQRCLEAYRAHCGRGLPLCTHCQETLKTAATLCRGDFMAGFSLPGSPDFEFWLLVNQERHHRRSLEVIGRLGAFYETIGDYGQAAGCAQRLVTLEPWRQSFQRLLMRNLALAGQWQAAMGQYARCQQLLADELGIAPAKKTRRLYELIRDQNVQMLRQEADGRHHGFATSVAAGKGALPQPRSLKLKSASTSGESSSSLFVGREEELAKLNDYLTQALDDRGAVVFICGEAGSGKSSLAAEFVRRAMVANDSLLAAFGGCDARLGLGDAYQPFREVLRQLTGYAFSEASWSPVGDEAIRRLQAAKSSIRRVLVRIGPDLPGTLLPRSLAAAGPGRAHNQGGLPQAALFEQVTDLLRAVASDRPLVLVLDDLHWIDPTSANLLFYLGRHLGSSRILILGTYRPEQIRWLAPTQKPAIRHPLLPVIQELQRTHGQIEIDLDRAEGQAFVDALVDSEANRLGPEFRARLLRRTGGNPLFTVDILRGLQDRGELRRDADGYWVVNQELKWDDIPVRVEASIAARFGRLSEPCRRLLCAASVQGQTFVAEITAEVVGEDATSAVTWLSETLGRQHRLVEAGGLEWYDDQCLSRFRFRHHLFQQCAYRQLDQVSRAHLHRETGLALEALHADCKEEHALELAGHFQAAGMVEKAVMYLQLAGRVAYRLAANESSLNRFDQALMLLAELSPGPVRLRQEMRLHLDRTGPLLALRGYAVPEMKEAAKKVVSLAEQLDEPDYLFAARLLLVSHHSMLAKYETAGELADLLLEQAKTDQNQLHLTQAHHFLGYLRFCAGSFAEALEHFDSAIAYHDSRSESLIMARFIGQNMWLTTMFRKAWTLWFLGYPDQSEDLLKETMHHVEKVGRDHDLAFSLAFGYCPILFMRREFDQAEGHVKRLMELATRKGLSYFIPFAQIFLGILQARQGQSVEGQKKIRAGIRAYRASGQKTILTFSLAFLIDSLGQGKEASEVLDEALTVIQETGECFYEAELWRLYGQYLCRRGRIDEAEKFFLRALTIAKGQQAKSLQLRAAISLAELWGCQERGEEAAQLLGKIYRSYTEGFKTPDLYDAQRLLAALQGSELVPSGAS